MYAMCAVNPVNTRPAWMVTAGITAVITADRMYSGVVGGIGSRINSDRIIRIIAITKRRISHLISSSQDGMIQLMHGSLIVMLAL